MGGITWNALVLGKDEAAPTPLPPHTVVIPLDTADPDKFRSDVLSTLAQQQLTPPSAARDLYRLAAAAFACDVSFPRASAYDSWTRHIRLSLSVTDLALWQNAQQRVAHLLTYLSGDQWEVVFTAYSTPDTGAAEITVPPTPATPAIAPFKPDAVCLFSGGLDSFIGAADRLAAGQKLTLVSHHGAGSATHASPAQTNLKGLMRQHYPNQFQDYSFNVDPRKGLTGSAEPTTRSRSLVFLSLGALLAATQQATTLYIPENGLITLNIPLTYSRLGSSSTRTTHPHTLHLFQQVLDAVGINVKVENPYRYSTKGEMLAKAGNQALVQAGLPHTMSCAHPTAGRFQGVGVRHCGYCVPCIIRASAEHGAGISSPTQLAPYRYDIRLRNLAQANLTDQKNRDLRAFQMAILRAQQQPPGAAWVLRSGSLASDSANIAKYVGVYTRGLREVEAFLNS